MQPRDWSFLSSSSPVWNQGLVPGPMGGSPVEKRPGGKPLGLTRGKEQGFNTLGPGGGTPGNGGGTPARGTLGVPPKLGFPSPRERGGGLPAKGAGELSTKRGANPRGGGKHPFLVGELWAPPSWAAGGAKKHTRCNNTEGGGNNRCAVENQQEIWGGAHNKVREEDTAHKKRRG